MRKRTSRLVFKSAKGADARREAAKETADSRRSARHRARFARVLKTQFGHCLPRFLLGISLTFGGSAFAQTRLSSPQVPALNGALTGTFSGVKLRDINSSRDHGDGLDNGIAHGITDCGTTVSCSILVPPSYTISEQTPGLTLDPAGTAAASTTPGNITVFDRRFGDARIAVNPIGYHTGLITTPNGWVYDYFRKALPAAVLTDLYILQNSWDGGTNQQNTSLNYTDKTQWTPMQLKSNSYTPAQHVTAGLTTFSASVGDTIGVSDHVHCSGGLNTQGDVGCRAMDNKVLEGNVEYTGTLTASPVAGTTAVTVLPSQGASTQGAGRFLIKTNAGTLSAGTISTITTGSYAMTALTGSGTAWPVSQVIAQLGTSVTAPGSATVAPSNFTAGSLSLITTTTLVCVADATSFEMVYPSAVTAGGFTAAFFKVHSSASTIAVGGVCGYLLDLTADDLTNSSYAVHSQPVTGTLHFAWPLVSSASPASAVMWVAAAGAYQQLVTRWNATSANGFVMYPFAEVISTQQSGGLSNTLRLGPNNVSWSAGDSVAELLYPAMSMRAGNNVVEAYYPNLAPDKHNFGFTYNSPLQGTDTMLLLANNTPSSFYSSYGGKYTSPWGIHLQGQTKYGVFFDTPSDQATLGVGCATPCVSTQNVLAVANPSYYDFLQYDEGNDRWSIGAGSNSVHYTFGGTRLSTPMPNLYLSTDSVNNGFVAAQSVRSGLATNTDAGGELVFSNSLSVTYTFLGAYASHPECSVKPQMDIGSGNRHWITYSNPSSFTINFASAVSGSVSYSCLGRN